MRILAIGAHPDDVEIFCGGTLAKYASEGHHVVIASVTNGEIGSTVLPPEEISAIRKLEGEAAARIIGAEFVWMGYRDQQFMITQEARNDFIDLFRYVKPDVVLTHYPDFFSADHSLVGRIVNDISLIPLAPNVRTNYPPIDKAPILYFWDAPGGVNFLPEEYVDISEHMETKRALLRAHKSQDDWLKFHCGTGITEEAEIIGRFRGLQIGVKYAEGFIRAKAWSRGIAGTLLP